MLEEEAYKLIEEQLHVINVALQTCKQIADEAGIIFNVPLPVADPSSLKYVSAKAWNNKVKGWSYSTADCELGAKGWQGVY